MINCTFAVLYYNTMADISCNLPLPLLKRLEEEKKNSGGSTTILVQEALTLYFMAKDRERQAPVLDPLRYYPLPIPEDIPELPTPYIQNGVIVTKEIQEELKEIVKEGLTMPDMTKVRQRPVVDPDIKTSFHLSEIKGGPGVVKRLEAAGIKAIDIVKAKRAKARGVTYDMTLEKYFDLLNA
jgi:hypothetical protein